MSLANKLDTILVYLIVGMNVALRYISMEIVDLMGCKTESQRMMYITKSIFISQFFNTGILLMLVNANFTF